MTGAEDDYREAVECLADGPLRPYQGRAHLLYGEWLRRKGRGKDCLRELRTAHSLLSAAGAEAFAGRAADELRAAGQRVERRSTPAAHEQLTTQQVAVARLVAAGPRRTRSPPSCSSASARSTRTCGRSSASSV